MMWNVLPGLREVRAPLIAGYLLMLAGWFAVAPLLPAGGPDGGVLGSAVELHGAVSVFGTAAASAVAAYLIGSVSEGVFSFLWRRQQGFGGFLFRSPLSPRGEKTLREIADREAEAAARAIARGRGQSLAALIAERPDLSGVPTLAALIDAARRQLGNIYGDSRRLASELDANLTFATALSQQVEGEADLLATRLLGAEPEIFGAFDRLRSEAELRYAVAVPLFALSAVLAIRSCHPAWLAFIPAVVVLWFQGSTRARESRDLIFDTLLLGRVRSPTIERLREDLELFAGPEAEPGSEPESAAVRVPTWRARLAALIAPAPAA
jgi:hypothetical protein